MDEKPRWRIKSITSTSFFWWGLTIFTVGALLVLFYHFLTNYSGFRFGLTKFKNILSPFIYGFVMAYLLSPIFNAVIRRLYPKLEPKTKTKKTALTLSKVVATLVCLAVLFGVVGGMLALLVPQVIESIRGLTATLPGRFDQVSSWLNEILAGFENQEVAESINNGFNEFQDHILTWIQDTLLPGVGSFMQRLSTGVMVTIRTAFNIIIGVIACVYFLNGKEKFRAQFKMIISAFFSEKRATGIYDFFAFSNKTFGGFITGKLIDSLIIGVLCFVAMRIVGLPYPILISTIIGVTNIIPFFGPFIGAIPSIAIICIISPMQALYFLILVVILQQLDGNVIGPAILGNSLGIASFWVMFAIVVGGGLFGFLGMVIGVPIFAIIYYYLSRYVDKRLKEKELDAKTKDYLSYEKYGLEAEVILNEESK